MMNKQQYFVRKLTKDDEMIWTKLWKEYIVFYESKLEDEITKNTFLNLISDRNDVGGLVICNERNTPVGFLHYVLHFSTWSLLPKCYLYDLYVLKEFRKNGCARLLIEKLNDLTKQNKWNGIYWITKKDNLVAQSLYDKIAQKTDWLRYEM